MPTVYTKPIPQLSQSEADRFWARVDKSPGQGPKKIWAFGTDPSHLTVMKRNCWFWTGAVSRRYGAHKVQASQYHTHRIAFALARVPPGHALVLHKCDEPLCCNPEHLFLGSSHRINSTDKIRKGRDRGPATENAKKTHCNYGHVLPPSPNKHGTRLCKSCQQRRERARVRDQSEFWKQRWQKLKADPDKHKAWKQTLAAYMREYRAKQKLTHD